MEFKSTGSRISAVSKTKIFQGKRLVGWKEFRLTLCLLDPPEPGEVQVGGDLAGYGQLNVPAHGPRQLQSLHSKTAIVKT